MTDRRSTEKVRRTVRSGAEDATSGKRATKGQSPKKTAKTKRARKSTARRGKSTPAAVLGWREWAQLPDLGVLFIKAKLDTGARTSALHAFELRSFVRDGVDMVRFQVHPVQRSRASSVFVEAEVLETRVVRNSGGHAEARPVIETTVQIGEDRWPIELTLTRRDEMGFRMLLGRQALRGRAVVDPGTSFRAGRPGMPPSRKRARKAESKGEEE